MKSLLAAVASLDSVYDEDGIGDISVEIIDLQEKLDAIHAKHKQNKGS